MFFADFWGYQSKNSNHFSKAILSVISRAYDVSLFYLSWLGLPERAINLVLKAQNRKE